MMDKQLEMMAQKASNYIPASKRGDKPVARPADGTAPVVKGVEAGVESTSVKPAGGPAVEAKKEYVKPFESKAAPKQMPPKANGGFNKGAAQRMFGRMQ